MYYISDLKYTSIYKTYYKFIVGFAYFKLGHDFGPIFQGRDQCKSKTLD